MRESDREGAGHPERGGWAAGKGDQDQREDDLREGGEAHGQLNRLITLFRIACYCRKGMAISQ